MKSVIVFVLLLFLTSCGEEKSEEITLVLNLENHLDSKDLVYAIEDFKKDTRFSHITLVIPPKQEDYHTRMPIDVASGKVLDLIAVYNPIKLEEYTSQKLIVPLNTYFNELNVDFDKRFTGYRSLSSVGENLMMVPYNPTRWVMYYNKNHFDKLAEPYPDSKEPLTWDEYRSLAKKLTYTESNNTHYGALHLLWPMYWYGEAIMELGGGEQFYNNEGLSNISNPSFINALRKTYKMMHVDKSVPTYAQIMINKTVPYEFFTGNYAMFLQGPWVLSWSVDKEQFSRSFELGVAPMPVNTSSTNRKTWGVVGGFAVPKTSKYPKEAVMVGIELTRLAGKYAKHSKSTNTESENSKLFLEIEKILSSEGLTQVLLNDVFFGDDIEFITEKVTGKSSYDYEKIINREVEAYFLKKQSLEMTIDNIERDANILLSNSDVLE